MPAVYDSRAGRGLGVTMRSESNLATPSCDLSGLHMEAVRDMQRCTDMHEGGSESK